MERDISAPPKQKKIAMDVTDNILSEWQERNLHCKAVAFFEKHKKELQKRPVKRVPAGFSYDVERLKESVKKQREKMNN